MLGSYVRGRLLIAGVSDKTSARDALDILTVILMDTPGEALRKWRDGLDRAVLASRIPSRPSGPDRSTWGLHPDQVAATRRFLGNWGA